MIIKTPDFFLPLTSNGVANSVSSFTMNGTTVTPDFVLAGGQATATSWSTYNYGSETFTLSGSGTNPTPSWGTPFIMSSLDNSLQFDIGTPKCLSASGNSIGNFGLNDFVFEFVFYKDHQNSFRDLIHKGYSNGAGDRNNWSIVHRIGDMGMYFESNGITGYANVGVVSDIKTWSHVLMIGDRNSNLEVYIDGFGPYTADISALGATNFTTTNKLTLGGIDGWGGTNRAAGDAFAYLAMWQSNGWVLNTAPGLVERQNIAKERFQRFTGIWPTTHNGSALFKNFATYAGGGVPADLSKFFDKYESGIKRIYKVNGNWPKLTIRQDASNNSVTGLLAEAFDTPIKNNLTPGAGGTNINAGVLANNINSPLQIKDANAIVGSAANASHGYEDSGGRNANTPTVLSCYFKAGNNNFAYIADNDQTNTWAYFNLATGIIGSKGAYVVNHNIEPITGGWYRGWIYHTGSNAGCTMRVYSATADAGAANPTYVGDGVTTNIYLWGALAENAIWNPKNVKNDNGNALRKNLLYQFTASDGNIGGLGNNAQGKMMCNVLIPISQSYFGDTAISLYNATLNNYISLSGALPTNSPSYSVINTGVTQVMITSSVNATTNVSRELFCNWDLNNSSLYVDSALKENDTSGTPPASLDLITIGARTNDANPFLRNSLDGLIWNVYINGSSAIDPLVVTSSSNIFNFTSTSNSAFKKQVYISGIKLFDENKRLIGIAKLANPVKKDEETELTIKLVLDT